MKYLIRGKFTVQGLKELQKEGATKRIERAKERFRLLGARIEQAYFAASRGEVIGIAEAEPEVMAAILFAMNANGHIDEEVVPLVSLEEMDKVIELSRSVRLPGQ